jgi:hypothetical protein
MRYFLFYIVTLLSIPCLEGQVKIGGQSGTIDSSAVLELESSNRGFLPPRLTQAQISGIVSPATGLIVFNTGTNCLQTYIPPGGWQNIFCGCNPPTAPIAKTSLNLSGAITWRWNSVPGALGYKWNSSNTYSTAIDLGDSLQYTQTGLSCDSAYSSYVWAYDACGASSPTLLSDTLWCPIAATGGQVFDYVGNGSNGNLGVTYRVHRFTQVGNSSFSVSSLGSSNQVDYLIVAGGGGGGFDFAGGGGAGGFLTGSLNISLQTYTIAVGAGGAPASQFTFQAQSGQNSSAFGQTAIGGGAARSGSMPGCNSVALTGGSGGGGGAWMSCAFPGAAGTPGQGHAGANGAGLDPNTGSRGGGGGGAGGAGVLGNLGGHGGPGLSSAITGSTLWFAGGGGGGTMNSSIPGSGGQGGGGNGASGMNNSGISGQANTGGGGGGSSGGGQGGTGGAGGSGIVVIRYPITSP